MGGGVYGVNGISSPNSKLSDLGDAPGVTSASPSSLSHPSVSRWTSASSARIHLRSWHGSTVGYREHVGRIRLPMGRARASFTTLRLNSTE